ncbi:hypothetical protein [Lampropedia aestuarii]|nr:hypothetical protein [Lampropedia aestuarii]
MTNPQNTEAMDVWLVQQLIGTAELLGQQLSPTAAAMLATDLSSYPQQVVAHALSRVRAEHAGRLTAKAILDRIDDAVGRPTAHEAWAIALTSLDERNTVVWTNEMADAWLVASPLAKANDNFGARNAFVSAYERIVRAAKEAKALPVVTVSIGWDAQCRNPAIERALSLGYITPERAAQEIDPALPAPTFNPVALLTGRIEPESTMPPDTRERFAAMRKELNESARRHEAKKEAERKRAADELNQKKAEAQRRADECMAAEQSTGGESWA